MGALADYLRIARAQTAAVEGAGFPLAAWIGGAPLWTLPLFAVLGILCHFAGFGENSLSDLAFDRLDPSKADHPVVAGRVSAGAGWAFVIALQLIAAELMVVIVWRTGAWVALAPFAGYVLLGHAYNFLGKRNKPLAVLEISGAFALAFLAMATAWGRSPGGLVWAVVAYAFVMTAFQIAIAGEVKELGQANERNLLRRIGTRVESGRLTGGWPPYGFLLATALSLAKAVALGVVAYAVAGLGWGIVVYAASWIGFMAYTLLLLYPDAFDRPRRLRIMGLGEAASYLFLVTALLPALAPWLWVPFVVLPVLWFGALNRALWARTGSAWAPGV